MGFAGRIPGLQREKAPGPLTRLAPCRPQGAEGESAGQRSPQLTWAPGGARPARLGQASAPPSGARLLTAAEAPMGRAAGPRPLSQRSRRACWGLRFPWQQHGLKLVQSLEGRSERALLWDGLLRGRGGGTGRRGPQDPQETTPKAGERAVARRAFSDPGWTLAPDMWAAATPRSGLSLPARHHRLQARTACLSGGALPASSPGPPATPSSHLSPDLSTLLAGRADPHPPHLAQDERPRKKNPCR